MTFLKRSLVLGLLGAGLWFSTLPSYAMTTLSGEPIKMEQLVGKGRWAAVEIWASYCSVCRENMHHLIEIDQKIPAIDVFGISIDDQEGKEEAQRFIQQHKMRFPNMLSNSAEMGSYLMKHADEGFLGTPTLLLFSPKGQLVAVQPGPVTVDELKKFIEKL
jgi:thiol-disulfide isomerase/thioredoxin